MAAPGTFSSDGSTESPTIRKAQLITFCPSEPDTENNDFEFESDDDGEDNLHTTKKIRCLSNVWDDFIEVTLPYGAVKAECVHCGHHLSFDKNDSTMHLQRHLSNCIKEEGDEEEEESQSVSSPSFEHDHAKLREILSDMILVHELPFEFPEYGMFNVLMRSLNPDYQMISSDTVKKDCIASFELEKKKLMVELKKVDRVSVTTDLWKFDQNTSYMVITCHYVDANWNLQKRNLNFCEVPPPHSGLELCDVLHKCLVEWKIEKKVETVTVDNAEHNDVAVRILKETLSYNNNLSLNGKFFHVRCYAHIINLLAQDILSTIQGLIVKVRESVEYVTTSEMRINVFRGIAKQLESDSMDLILDCCTKWEVTHFMLSSAINLKDVFTKYQQIDTSYTLFPSEEEWEKVRVVCSFLEEFFEDIELARGKKYPTSNCFLNVLACLKDFLSETNVGEDPYMKDMVTKMKVKFDKYWGDSILLFSVAAVLDPRYKMECIEWCFQESCSSSDADEHRITVRETLCLLYNEYVEADKAKRFKSSSSVSNVGVRNAMEVKSELDEYLEESLVIDEDTDFDALSWWRQNNTKFRILSKMACDVLSIPLTTVASEAICSAGSKVIDPHHASLGVDTMQVLLCAGDWLRARYGIKRTSGMEDYQVISII